MSFLKNPKVEMFNGRKHIHIVQHKTKKPVFIPLKQIILDILEKRGGNFPHYIHQNLINKEIKSLLRKCGVTELYPIEKTIGGKLVSELKPKYKLISSHSAENPSAPMLITLECPFRILWTSLGMAPRKWYCFILIVC